MVESKKWCRECFQCILHHRLTIQTVFSVSIDRQKLKYIYYIVVNKYFFMDYIAFAFSF